jgi:hypothetical protein
VVKNDGGDVVSLITDDQIDFTFSAFSSSSSDYVIIVNSGSSAIILRLVMLIW